MGFAARSRLQGMKDTDPEFWNELTSKRLQDLAPDKEDTQPEGDELTDNDEILAASNDSNIPISVVIEAILCEWYLDVTRGNAQVWCCHGAV